MKTILVPTDFSDSASNALYYAAALASQTQSRLVLVHAIAMDVVELPGNPFELKPDLRLETYYLAKLEHLASRIRVKHGTRLQVDTVCVHGSIQDHLNELVLSQQADLVVMGTNGAHTVLKKLMGTNTARCIQQAICPILAIPISAWYQGIKRIAYASDFENNDTHYLQQLFGFAGPLNLEVYIFNVKSDDQLDLEDDNHILRQIKRHFPDNRYSVAQLKENDVVAGIQAFIRENQMDVLALAVHKRDFLERIFHSGAWEELAFQTSVPLLALPEKPYRHARAVDAESHHPLQEH